MEQNIERSPMQEEGNPSPSVPWGWRDIGLIVVIIVVSLYLVGMALQLANRFAWVAVDNTMTSPIVYATITLIYGLLLACIYLFGVRKGGWRPLGIGAVPWAILSLTPFLLVAELLGIIGMNNIVEIMMGKPFENPQVESLSTGRAFSTQELAMLMLLIAGLAPLAEELFFRGMLYPLLRRWGGGVAIVGSAVLFSLVHFIPILFPSLFVVGLLLGLLREWSGSTIPCIVLHMMQNGTMIVLLHLAMTTGGVQ
jgi:uncharacterized protein